MQLDDSPLYRRTIIPWYDSETACLLVVVFMFPVVLFALGGIKVADEHAQYQAFAWLPVLLAVLASWVIVSTTFRLVQRFLLRYSRKDI
jgi:hypothetical protein